MQELAGSMARGSRKHLCVGAPLDHDAVVYEEHLVGDLLVKRISCVTTTID